MTVVLPWGAQKETAKPQMMGEMELRPGEFVMRTLFAEFTMQAEKKMEAVMTEPVSQQNYYKAKLNFNDIIFFFF